MTKMVIFYKDQWFNFLDYCSKNTFEKRNWTFFLFLSFYIGFHIDKNNLLCHFISALSYMLKLIQKYLICVKNKHKKFHLRRLASKGVIKRQSLCVERDLSKWLQHVPTYSVFQQILMVASTLKLYISLLFLLYLYVIRLDNLSFCNC